MKTKAVDYQMKIDQQIAVLAVASEFRAGQITSEQFLKEMDQVIKYHFMPKIISDETITQQRFKDIEVEYLTERAETIYITQGESSILVERENLSWFIQILERKL